MPIIIANCKNCEFYMPYNATTGEDYEYTEKNPTGEDCIADPVPLNLKNRKTYKPCRYHSLKREGK